MLVVFLTVLEEMQKQTIPSSKQINKGVEIKTALLKTRMQ